MENYYGKAVALMVEADLCDMDVNEVLLVADTIKEEGLEEAVKTVKIMKKLWKVGHNA